MDSLLTFDLLVVLVIVCLLIVTVSCVVLERPPAPGRYYEQQQQSSMPSWRLTDEEDPRSETQAVQLWNTTNPEGGQSRLSLFVSNRSRRAHLVKTVVIFLSSSSPPFFPSLLHHSSLSLWPLAHVITCSTCNLSCLTAIINVCLLCKRACFHSKCLCLVQCT